MSAIAIAWVSLSDIGVARGDDAAPRGENPGDKAAADALFQDARTLLVQGRTSEACAKFGSSYHIDPQVGTLLFLATCHETEGKTATALSEFKAAVTAMHRAHNAKREAYAQQHLDALDAKLSRLVLTAPSVAIGGLEVKVDDQAIDPGSLGAPLPVDPGTHTITAAAPERRSWSTTVDVAEGPVDVPIAIPTLDRDEPQPAATPAVPVESTATPAAPAPSPAATPIPRLAATGERPAPSTNSGNAAIAYVAGGIGIGGLALGVATGIVALIDKDDADSGSCAGRYCTQHGLNLYSQATTAAWISTGAFAAGATGAAVALSALLLGHHAQSEHARLEVLPTVGGIQLDGAW